MIIINIWQFTMPPTANRLSQFIQISISYYTWVLSCEWSFNLWPLWPKAQSVPDVARKNIGQRWMLIIASPASMLDSKSNYGAYTLRRKCQFPTTQMPPTHHTQLTAAHTHTHTHINLWATDSRPKLHLRMIYNSVVQRSKAASAQAMQSRTDRAPNPNLFP